MALLENLHNFLGRIDIALITILIGFIIAKLASRIAKRVMAEAELNRIFVSAGLKPLSDVIGVTLEYLIYIATVLVVLQQFGLTKTVFGIIAVIAIIIIGIALFLALRDFVPNAVAGMFIRRKLKQYVGKKVQIGSVNGRLEHVGVIASKVANHDTHYVPHLYTSKNITRFRAG